MTYCELFNRIDSIAIPYPEYKKTTDESVVNKFYVKVLFLNTKLQPQLLFLRLVFSFFFHHRKAFCA